MKTFGGTPMKGTRMKKMVRVRKQSSGVSKGGPSFGFGKKKY